MAAKKSSAKKATAKKSSARKSAAKKTTARKSAAKKSTRKSTAKKSAGKSASKRTMIAPNDDKRYIRRDKKGRIKESADQGKSLSVTPESAQRKR